MRINTTSTSTSVRMQEGTEQIAALRLDANEGHIAEHIRAMVAGDHGTTVDAHVRRHQN